MPLLIFFPLYDSVASKINEHYLPISIPLYQNLILQIQCLKHRFSYFLKEKILRHSLRRYALSAL